MAEHRDRYLGLADDDRLAGAVRRRLAERAAAHELSHRRAALIAELVDDERLDRDLRARLRDELAELPPLDAQEGL